MAFRIRRQVFGAQHPSLLAIATGALGVLLFAAPLLFLPMSLDHWEIPKTALAVLGASVALFVTAIIVWREKRLPNIWHRGDIAWMIFAIALLLSLFFSIHPVSSFFGIRGNYGDGMLGVFSMLTLFVLVRALFRDVRVLLVAFWMTMASCTLGALAFLFGILGFPILGSYSTFPLVANSLIIMSIVSALSFASMGYVVMRGAGQWRMLLMGGMAIHVLLLCILDLNVAWYLILFLLLLSAYLLSIRSTFTWRVGAILGAFAVLMIVALLVDLTAFTKATLVPDVLLGQGASAHIAWETIQAHPVVGSGPATFLYDYMRFAPAELYQASGGAQFVRAGSEWWQWITTLGIAGAVLLGIIIGILVRVFMAITPRDKRDTTGGPLALDLVFLMLCGLFFASLFFPLHFTVLLLWFFFLGMAEVLLALRSRRGQDTSIEKKAVSWSRVGVVAVGTVAVLASFFVLRVLGSEVWFGSALRAAEQEEDLAVVGERLRTAVGMAPWDASLLASLAEQQAIQGAIQGDAVSRADDVQSWFAEARKKNALQPAIISAELRAHSYMGAASPFSISDVEGMLSTRMMQEPGQATHYLAYAQFALEVYEQQIQADADNTDDTRLQQSQVLLTQAKERNAYLPGIDYTQARIYSLQGKHDDAITLLEALMQFYPNVQDFRDALATEYDLTNQPEKAEALRSGSNPTDTGN